jgi:toxin ParE1/3/4
MAYVAADPARGRACEDVRAGYRKYSVGAHALFYKTTQEGVDIMRILHRQMDFERHL